MKWLTVVVVVVLVGAGALFGYSIAKNGSDTSSSNTSGATSGGASATVLDLSNRGLTKVDSSIYSKTATTELILSNNTLRSLPSEMGKMTNVVVFKVDHNALDGSLIAEVRQMARLKTLDVSYNNMTGVPAEIGQLRSLETLNYSHNKITAFPNEIANLKGNLKELDLTGNPLDSATLSKLRTLLPNTRIIF